MPIGIYDRKNPLGDIKCLHCEKEFHPKRRTTKFCSVYCQQKHPFSEERKIKIGNAHRGKIMSLESRIKMSKSRQGIKLSKETIEKMIRSRTGHNVSDETRKKIGTANTKNNPGYRAIHKFVNRKKGKAKICSICGKSGSGREIHWANINHKYKRRLDDYLEICIKCHGTYDKKRGLRKQNNII